MIKEQIKKITDSMFELLTETQQIKIQSHFFDCKNFDKKYYIKKMFFFNCLNIINLKKISLDKFLFYDYNSKEYLTNKQFIEICKEFDVISFDIFDTILFRKTRKPTDIFKLVEKETNFIDFKNIRINAEEMARKNEYKVNNTFEISLNDIYDSDINLSKNKFNLIRKELEIEKNNIYVNPIMKKNILTLKNMNKNIICTSDMYLSKYQIKKMFDDDTLNNIDEFFVSVEYKVSKSSGELYEIIKNKYPKGSILHIGDNFFSDVLMSKKNDIYSIQYLRRK